MNFSQQNLNLIDFLTFLIDRLERKLFIELHRYETMEEFDDFYFSVEL